MSTGHPELDNASTDMCGGRGIELDWDIVDGTEHRRGYGGVCWDVLEGMGGV